MSFAEAGARLQDAVFDRLGEDAAWESVADPVRVIRREEDEPLRFDQGSIIETGRTMRVRKTEVPSPSVGQSVQLLDEAGDPVSGGLYAVSGEPMLDRKGVWHCTVTLS